MDLSFSKNILQVKPSATVALNAKASALRKEGFSVLNFAVGEPDYDTPSVVIEAAHTALKNHRTKYGAPGGGIELRTAIAEKLLKENRLIFRPEQIVVGIGAKEILFHLMLSVLNPRDEVLIPCPYWVSYADQVIAAGATPVPVPVPSSFPEIPIDLVELDKMASPRTVAIILNSPNNPSGYILSRDQLHAIGNYLKDKRWWVVSDEIYEYLAFDSEHMSLLELYPELTDRFVLVNGFSKAFAMTGWRVGYCAAPPNLARLVQSLQSHSSTCLPGFIEDASVVAIKEGKPLVTDKLQVLDFRRKLAMDALNSVDISYVKPQGAFYVLLDFRKSLDKFKRSQIHSTFDFCEWLLKEHKMALVPGEAFGAPGFVRLSYAVSDTILKSGIDRLGKAFQMLNLLSQ